MTFFSILGLAFKSLKNRRLTALLTVFSIAVSVTLLIGVEKVRTEARASFANTVSGTDLIVGARSGSVQLLLYSVFRIGNATANISWRTYQALAGRSEVAWTIPLSLGDSHKGYRVLGTNADYFRHYRYAGKSALKLRQGKPFEAVFDVVLGAEVARALGYHLGDAVILTHGLGREGISSHKDTPFTVIGILARTGTPVDRTVHISLEGMEAIHVDWKDGVRIPGMTKTVDEIRQMELRPKSITAFLVGLKSRFGAFAFQRTVNEFRREPLSAIFPGVALQELWDLMGTAEGALSVVSVFVVVSGLLGMSTMLLSSLNERRREMAILRSVGARPSHVLGLLVTEAAVLTALGAVIGLAVLYGGLAMAQMAISEHFGLYLQVGLPSVREMQILGLVVCAGIIAGLIPGYRAYRQSLADGMIVRT